MEQSLTAFAALADPVRAGIVQLLARADLPAGDIAARFAVSRPAVSRHLRVLRQARLVSAREAGQQRIYSLEMGAMDEIEAWIAECRALWARRLDDFGHHLGRVATGQSAENHDDRD
jgi:DNA-binding transcriptional ArsR family regulator